MNKSDFGRLEPVMAYMSQLFETFIALPLNGPGSAEWFMNNLG